LEALIASDNLPGQLHLPELTGFNADAMTNYQAD
jgi:hypothetical protein